MYREMRRKDRKLEESEARELLKNCEYGFLATVSGEGQPYAVPVNYVVLDNYIYFHCALKGQKVDNIANENRVSFTAVGKTQPVYTDNFTTYFESTVVFGKAFLVEEQEEKCGALRELCMKYMPEHEDKIESAIQGSLRATAVYKISIDHISGKAKR